MMPQLCTGPSSRKAIYNNELYFGSSYGENYKTVVYFWLSFASSTSWGNVLQCHSCLCGEIEIKHVNFTLEQTTEAQKGSRGIAVLFL